MNNPEQPWLANPAWKNGQIHSDAAASWKFMAVFALLWNAFSFTVATIVLLDHPPRFPDPEYFVLLFPAVGLLLLWQAIRQYAQWRRHGQLNLTLSPYPGSIGGDIGGQLTLPSPTTELADLEATVSCLHVSISHSGKNSTRRESTTWRRRANTRVERAANGSRITFRVKVDPGLPNSEPPQGSHNLWRLHLRSKQAGLERSFDIPVFDTGYAEESRLHVDAEPQLVTQHDFPPGTVQIQHRADGLELIYPNSRTSKGLWIITLFGTMFAAIGGVLGYSAIGQFASGGLFSIAISGFLTLVFSTVGLALGALGLYLSFNELRVLIGREQVTTQRRIGPWRWSRSSPIGQITALEKSISMQASQGAAATVYYSINARTNDRDLALGDGIKGQPLADGLLQLMADELGIDLTATADQPVSRPGRRLYDPARAAKAKPLIKAAKWIGRIIMLIFVLLFVIQFLGIGSGR